MEYQILARDTNGALKYRGKQELGLGVPDLFSTGNAIFVAPYSGLDTNDGAAPSTPLKTLVAALALARADKGDTVYLMAESNTASLTTDYQAAALDWNKDGVHLVGVNCGSRIGQRSRIAELSSVKTIEDLFTVSADNCCIANIEVFQGVATYTGTAARAVVVTGQRNHFYNCQFSGNGDTGGTTDDAGARSLAVTGSENLFQKCYIGLDTVIRATQTCEVFVGTGARNIFEDCIINSWTSLSTFKALQATTYDRFVMLKNCILSAIQNITSAVAPTGAIGNTTPNGNIIMLGGGAFGYADVTTADDTKCLLLSYSGLAANVVDQGVAKGTDVA
jgi:hypothetical protein